MKKLYELKNQRATLLTDAEKALTKYDFAAVFPKLNKEQVLALMSGKGWQDILGNHDDNADDQPVIDDADFTQ
jgi:hypothetical protein